MKVTILGSGACVAEPGTGPDRLPNAALVQADKTNLLLECPEGVRFELSKLGFDYAKLDGILVSHFHPDHFVPLPLIQSIFVRGLRNMRYKKERLALIGPPRLKRGFNAVWRVKLPEFGRKYYPWPRLRFTELGRQRRRTRVGNIKITGELGYHAFGKANPVTYRLEHKNKILAYITDTYIRPKQHIIAKDANLLIIENSAHQRVDEGYGHLSAAAAARFARECKVKKMVLVHHYGPNNNPRIKVACRKAGFTGPVIVGGDGKTFKL